MNYIYCATELDEFGTDALSICADHFTGLAGMESSCLSPHHLPNGLGLNLSLLGHPHLAGFSSLL